jgi:nucleotide-binding universal stress UspA family protein
MFLNPLIGVDGQDGGRDAVALAALLAADCDRPMLAHVFPAWWRPALAYGRIARYGEARRLLTRERAAMGIDARLIAHGAAGAGTPGLRAAAVSSGLAWLGGHHGADLIVIGADEPSPAGWLLAGGIASRLLDEALCAVAIAPPGYRAPAALTRIEVADDVDSVLGEQTQELDLLVIESACLRAAVRRFEPSVSRRLARRTHCPLLVIPDCPISNERKELQLSCSRT